jgi:hypothetical protein
MKKIIQQTTIFRPLARFCGLVLPVLIMANAARAQITVSFSTADAGVTKSIPYWGYDTAWDSSDNEQRSIIFMGSGNVNLVRVSPAMNSALIGSDLWSASISDSDKAFESNLANKTKSLSPNAMWYFCQGAYDNWYRSSTYDVYPDRYAAGFQANVNYVYSLANRPTIWACDFFNEPDYSPNNEGSAADIYNVLYYMLNNATCRNFKMGGLGTLNADVALNWFNPLVGRATLGSTHWLAGSATSFKNLITTVKSRNCVACEPEVHNVGECIIGANYGLDAAIWWGPAERARGEFVQASTGGKRLGYAEDLTHAVAGAVYKTSSGKIKAFVGGSERSSSDTTITFTATDQNVYFNGQGPQRSYTVTAGGQDDEMVIDITWGSDPQPAINGRYKIINKNSGKALEVPGSSTANGTQLDQRTYTGALNQQWDVAPLPRSANDSSYYTIKAAHDGSAINLDAYSYANGGAINQWGYANQAQQHWYLEYVGGGYFKIHTRWDAKVMEVGGNSTADGGLVQQWDDAGTASQQWSFQSTGGGGGGGPIANGTYRLQNRADGLMVDNLGATTNGANVCQWASGSSNNQKWVVTYNSSGYYTLACVTGGLLLDTGGHTANGSTVQQWSSGSSANQHWTFTATDSGYYKIVSVACGQCVDTGGLTANGSALQLWSSGSSYNQQWKFGN